MIRATPAAPPISAWTIGKARELGLDLDHDGDVDVIDIKLLKPATPRRSTATIIGT